LFTVGVLFVVAEEEEVPEFTMCADMMVGSGESDEMVSDELEEEEDVFWG
jgi:hypothetical protein